MFISREQRYIRIDFAADGNDLRNLSSPAIDLFSPLYFYNFDLATIQLGFSFAVLPSNVY